MFYHQSHSLARLLLHLQLITLSETVVYLGLLSDKKVTPVLSVFKRTWPCDVDQNKLSAMHNPRKQRPRNRL